MDQKKTELNIIQDLLDSGMITAERAKELTNKVEEKYPQKTEKTEHSLVEKPKSSKWLVLSMIVILFIGLIFVFWKPSQMDDVEQYAQAQCACDSLNNEMYITEIDSLMNRCMRSEILLEDHFNLLVQKLDTAYAEFTFNVDTRSCHEKSELLKEELSAKYATSTNKKADFSRRVRKFKVSFQNYELLERIEQKKEQLAALKMPFKDANDLTETITNLEVWLNDFFAQINDSEFDANNWFDEEVLQYFDAKGLNPEKINMANQAADSLIHYTFNLGTLKLKGVETGLRIWSFKARKTERSSYPDYAYVRTVTFNLGVKNKKISFLYITSETPVKTVKVEGGC